MESILTTTPPPRPATEFVTLPELTAIFKAEGVGISYRELRVLYLTGKIPAVRFGNRPKVKLSMIRAMIEDVNSALYK